MPGATATAARVPEPTATFWAIKLLSTGVGEAISDFFVKAFDPVVVVLITAVVFAASFAIQITARRYVPWRYWSFVGMVAIFGTMVADATHIVLGVPYLVSTVAFAAGLVVILLAWYRTQGTISIHSITTTPRELFYWATVLATFALGTAVGDLTATTFSLGWLGSGVLFLILFAAAIIAVIRTRGAGAAGTPTFWTAYVLTRPLGASFADWLGMPPTSRGLGVGSLTVGAVGAVLIVVGVAALQIVHGGRRKEAALPEGAA